MSDNKQEEKKSDTKPEEVDKELSDLLDSALADFSTENEKGDGQKTADKEKEQPVTDAIDDVQWAESMIRQAAEQFEANIHTFLGGSDGENMAPEQLQQSFQRMAEAAQAAIQNQGFDNPEATDFATAISQTLNGINEATQNLQNPVLEGDFMSNMLSGMGQEGEGLMPFMQGMMQSLLSKDVLHPSLTAILEQYPEWLQKNEATLSKEDFERYKKQQDLMQSVCTELELETPEDSAEVRKDRFDKVLKMMQTLQDYGQPPAELVGDVPTGPPFDMPAPGAINPDQCSLM